jgi:hypothetical protein
VFGEHPLSDLARELLALERGRVEDEALKSRVLDRARAALEGERPSGVGLRQMASGPSKASSWRRALTLPLIAAALGAAGLAAAGAGLYVWRAPAVEPKQPPEVAVARSTSVAVGGALLQATSVDKGPSEPPPEPRVAATAPAGSEGPRALSVKQYATELLLLEPARSSISRGDYAAALTAIGQHRREFPNGQLSQEREALRVRALWGLGQRPAALAAARAFRQRYPRSALLSWLKDQGDQSP